MFINFILALSERIKKMQSVFKILVRYKKMGFWIDSICTEWLFMQVM